MTDTSGTSSGTSGQGGQSNPNDDGKNTGRDWTKGGDSRTGQESGTYPNYWSHKTRSGHSIIMDDSKGHETVTIQHRSGSLIQFTPEGAIHITAHNSMYRDTHGEERITITGANDITVKGDTSLRCYGDYNVTVHKDYNLTVMGDMNVTAKNMNRNVRGNMDTTAKNINKRVEGSCTYNTCGAHSIVAKGNMTVASRQESLHVGASKDVKIKSAKKGKIMMEAVEGDMLMKTRKGDFSGEFKGSGGQKVQLRTDNGSFNSTADQNMSSKAGGKYQVKATQQVGIKSDTSNIEVKAASGSIQQTAGQNYSASAGSSMDMRAPSGAATFAGQSTNINSLGGILSMVSQGAGINVDALSGLLNLNGGIGSIVSQLTQLEFNFGDILGAIDMPQISAAQADQPEQEPDLQGEISTWL